MRIALDAMGGDNAPEQTVKGAVNYLCQWPDENVKVILVGHEDVLRAEIEKYSFDEARINIVHVPKVVAMNDKPARIVKTKRNSSLVRIVELMKNGEADGAVSAGNTGALLSASLFLLDRIPGVRRPAICPLIPSAHGGFLLCDAGANVDVRARDLVQFALMARANSIHIFNQPRPRIGLLNIGTEVGKGNELTMRAHDLFVTHVDNFVGNVEARDVFAGVADVVICDGFVGNTMLKVVEGMVLHVAGWAQDKLKQHPVSKLALSLILRPALKEMARELNYEEHGGSPLLGINGILVVCHGTSNAKAIMNALRTATRCVNENLIASIQKGIKAHMDIFEEQNAFTAK
ncbi:MAG: phosphate acyltransferase PlsX [Fidelibacterota bacterium]|nr:MAG: phosphate acyltransferase PlsX [Candidatus Neomarinimicrobiota bacterium]